MTIRRTPLDFRVHEHLAGAFLGSLRPEPGPFLVYELTKTSLTTPEATQRLARALGLRQGEVVHAGLKDKHAVTTQHVSVRSSPGMPATAVAPGIEARVVGASSRHVEASDIACNAFEIVVRDLSPEACREIHRRANNLAMHTGGITFPNYFGEQRFGSARHARGFVAAALIKGDFDLALRLAIATPARKDSGHKRTFTRAAATQWGDWTTLARSLPACPERRPIEALAAGATPRDAFASLPNFLQTMYIDAFQSHLWNAAGSSIITGTPPDLDADPAYPPRRSLPDELATLELPTLGPETPLTPPWELPYRAILGQLNVTPDQLVVPGLRRPRFGTAFRPLLARAGDFAITGPTPDDLTPRRLMMKLAFSLPRGAYATVLLRALGQ